MDWTVITENAPLLLEGFMLTLQLLAISLMLGLALALPLSVMASSQRRAISWPVKLYTYVFRGTPLLIQLFIIYYGLSQFEWIKQSVLWSILKEPYWCAVIAFTLNTAAYTTELFCGAIAQTPKKEIEAAVATGMTRYQQYRHIILPSMFRRAIPAYGNETIFMLHATALAGVITLVDLFGAAKIINSRHYAPFEAFLTAGLFYLIITFSIVWLFKLLEGRMLKHLQPSI